MNMMSSSQFVVDLTTFQKWVFFIKKSFSLNIKVVEHISHSSIIQSKKIEIQKMLSLKFII
jgi:hypothetical protein